MARKLAAPPVNEEVASPFDDDAPAAPERAPAREEPKKRTTIDSFVAPVEDVEKAFDGVFNAIIVKDTEIESSYEKLRARLKIGEGRHEHGIINGALDDAEDNLWEAQRLYATTVAARKHFELNSEAAAAALRASATALLQAEKDSGKRNKAITDADVTAVMAAQFPDEWRHQEDRRIKWSVTEDSLKQLVAAWASRCKSLAAMLNKSR